MITPDRPSRAAFVAVGLLTASLVSIFFLAIASAASAR